MPALKDIVREAIITLLASIGPANPPPMFMRAIMAISEVFDRLLHLYPLLWSRQSIRRLITRHDLFRSSHKTGFIPLVAGTGLPALSAGIAEFCAAGTAMIHVSQFQIGE